MDSAKKNITSLNYKLTSVNKYAIKHEKGTQFNQHLKIFFF